MNTWLVSLVRYSGPFNLNLREEVFRNIENKTRKLIYMLMIAQSDGAVEYTDFFSAKGRDRPMNVLDITLNNLMVKFQ